MKDSGRRGYGIVAHCRVSRLVLVVFATISALGACARYEPRPLSKDADLVPAASNLIAIGRGRVTIKTLDRLVLANNRDLRAVRAQLGVAEAQVIIAGILPNPQVTASYPFLIAGPGTADAYSAGFVQDLKSLLLLQTKGEVARAAAGSVRSSLLWQEWQTIGKARLLYVDIVSGEKALGFLIQTRELLKQRFDLTKKAIGDGNATLATLSPDLVAVGDVEKTIDDLTRLQLSRRHQLAVLLGLTPDAPLELSKAIDVPRINGAGIRRDLVTLADRRPDLIALQFGYRSEDAKVRQAILAQFPNLAVGLFAGRDTTKVLSIGPQLTMDLPLFDRNLGGIALESATREQLHREFNARLTASTAEIKALLTDQSLVAAQLAALEPRLREARSIATTTENAFKQGTFDERAYVDIQSARLAREQEKVGLQQTLLDGQVGLATLVGAGFPTVTIEPEGAPADPFGLLREVSQ